MRRQVVWAVTVEEARAVVQIEVGRHPPGQAQVEAGGESVALVVVEVEIGIFGRREGGKADGDATESLSVLVRVGEMPLDASADTRRGGTGLPSPDARAFDSEREKDVGGAEHVVVKEIPHASAEVGHIESPASQGNGQAEFALLIALAASRQTTEALLGCEVEQWSRNRAQRGRLVVSPPESARDPAESRNANGGADAGIGRILADRAVEVGEAYAAIEG